MKRTTEIVEAVREAHHAEYVKALGEGRRQRAATFTDRKKDQSRKACRKGNW